MIETLQQTATYLQIVLWVYLRDPNFYYQTGLFLLLVLAAWLIARSLKQVQWKLPGWHWQSGLTPFYFPALGLIGGRVIATALAFYQIDAPIFGRLYTLFWLVLVYRMALALMRRLMPTSAEMVRRRILLPLLALSIVLRLAGQLGPILFILNNTQLGVIGEGANRIPITITTLIFGPLAVILIYVVSQGVRSLLIEDMLPQAGFSPSRSFAVGTLISYAIVALGVFLTLRGVGINPGTLAVLGSALAVGIGFGMQNTVNNLVSGFLIMFDPFINVGDLVEVSNERGRIRNIGIRNTLIETADGTRVVMPNATLASSPLLNLNLSNRPVRGTLALPVAIGADPRVVSEAIATIVNGHPDVRPRPAPAVVLKSFAQGVMNFEVTFWVEDAARLGAVTHDVNLATWTRLDQLGYQLAPEGASPMRG